MPKDKPIDRQKFYKAILNVYTDGIELTARECAVKLLPTGLTRVGMRFEVQPRIVEMVKLGWLETVGSKFDTTTQKTVTIYRKGQK